MQFNVNFLRNAAEIYGDGDSEQALLGLLPATEFSVGIDLRACLETDSLYIPAGERIAVGSGLAMEPAVDNLKKEGVAGFVFSRSGLGAKQGLVVAQGVGVIDPDYRGEIIVWLLNTSHKEMQLKCGDRMAQLVFLHYCRPEFRKVASLSPTDRGSGGFGHTGK